MAIRTIHEILADAEADLRAEVSDMLAETDPVWRAHLRDCVRGDIALVRDLRAEAITSPSATYDMAA